MSLLRPLGRTDGNVNYATLTLVVTNGITVTEGDAVYFDGSGRITNSSVAGARCVGVTQQTVTGNSAGTNKALVIVDQQMRYLIKNDNIGTTFAVTHVGTYFDLIGATGAQLVDTSTTSATTGQMICLEYNPQIDPVRTDTTYGVFMFAEHAFGKYTA
jgi:hypothetical protein